MNTELFTPPIATCRGRRLLQSFHSFTHNYAKYPTDSPSLTPPHFLRVFSACFELLYVRCKPQHKPILLLPAHLCESVCLTLNRKFNIGSVPHDGSRPTEQKHVRSAARSARLLQGVFLRRSELVGPVFFLAALQSLCLSCERS